MTLDVIIRSARLEDGETAIETLRLSITQLCESDHGGDADALASWLANKTAASWMRWMERPDVDIFVAERSGSVIGVAAVTHQGAVMLNYVRPSARFTGVSAALLNAMEGATRERGVDLCLLKSTKTAMAFYLARGYAPSADDRTRLEKALR